MLTVAFLVAGTQQAEAHMLKRPKSHNASQQLAYGYRLEHHGLTAIRWLKRYKRLVVSPFSLTRDGWLQEIKAHRWLISYGRSLEQKACYTLVWRGNIRCMDMVAPPHYSGWLCIHHYEGSWQDSGDPYWGGLQMDRGFMGTYAPRALLHKGYANSWTPLEQMWVAEFAYNAGRGYHPWPNTARYCNLI